MKNYFDKIKNNHPILYRLVDEIFPWFLGISLALLFGFIVFFAIYYELNKLSRALGSGIIVSEVVTIVLIIISIFPLFKKDAFKFNKDTILSFAVIIPFMIGFVHWYSISTARDTLEIKSRLCIIERDRNNQLKDPAIISRCALILSEYDPSKLRNK